tara:strand:- start:379 stop:939 length:561 start_codon:yes stop_codon:yes gene_type:complete
MRNDWLIYVTSCCVIFLFTLLFCTQVNAEQNTVSSTVTVDKTPPSAISPSVVINNSDICRTAVAGSVSTQIFGISSGITVDDPNCEAIKLSRALASLGLKVASVSILAQNDARVFDSLWLAGTYPPIQGKIGLEAKELWLLEENRHLIPEGSKIFPPIVEQPKDISKNEEIFKWSSLTAMLMLIIL